MSYSNIMLFNRVVDIDFKVTPKLQVPKAIEAPPHILMKNYKPSNSLAMIKSDEDYRKLKYASKVASSALYESMIRIKKGILKNGDEVDKFVHNYIIDKNCYPSSLGYQNFPKSICISPNDIVCHGIPNTFMFKKGDFINLDLTVYYKGMHADTSAMISIGDIHPKIKSLITETQNALYKSISKLKPGNKLTSIGDTIESYLSNQNLHVVKEFCGHGIGKEIHMYPYILHCKSPIPNSTVLKPGMVFTIEPIVCLYPYKNLYLLPDQWSIISPGNPSAQYEHTILITKTGYEILTLRPDDRQLL